jgi:hypothetical protein
VVVYSGDLSIVLKSRRTRQSPLRSWK